MCYSSRFKINYFAELRGSSEKGSTFVSLNSRLESYKEQEYFGTRGASVRRQPKTPAGCERGHQIIDVEGVHFPAQALQPCFEK